MTIDITTLGSLSVRDGGTEVGAFSRQPIRTALLVYLSVEREATRDAAMAVLWPERDRGRARHALSQTLYELKRTLGEEWVDAGGERLRVAEMVGTDAGRLARAVEESDYEVAVGLYNGPFLDGWHLVASAEFEGWVDRQRDRLAALYREACRGWVAECQALGQGAVAVETARQWATMEPLEPEAQHLLISLLLEADDPRSALRHYRSYERRLQQEDLEPLPETRRLLERVQLRAGHTPAGTAAGTTREDPGLAGGVGRVNPDDCRIAVLPFQHDGPPDERYFTQGFADELNSELARIPEIAVTARTSAIQFGEPDLPLSRIDKELGVTHVVQGSIRWDTMAVPPRIRIDAALVQVADGTHLWGRSYDVELADGFDVQDDMIAAITAAVGRSSRSPAPVAHTRTMAREREARELFLKAFQHANQRNETSLRTAADLYQRALVLKPDFARAYAGLAQVYAVFPGFTGAQPREWYLKARSAGHKALELDPDLAEAHAALAFPLFHLWDLDGAEHHLDRCVELAPSYAPAWVRRGYLFCATGRPRDAHHAAERALALDPLSVATNFDTGYQFWQLRDRDSALRQFRRVQQLDPRFNPAHFFLGAHSYQLGDLDTARLEFSRAEKLGPLWPPVVDRLHRPAEAVAALDRMIELAPGPVNYLLAAGFYTLFGAHDRALHWLEGHARNVQGEPGRLETGGPSLTHVARDPLFDPLRPDPRFRTLLRRMGLVADLRGSAEGSSGTRDDSAADNGGTDAADALLTTAERRMRESS